MTAHKNHGRAFSWRHFGFSGPEVGAALAAAVIPGGLAALSLLLVEDIIDPVVAVAGATAGAALMYAFQRAPECTLLCLWWAVLLTGPIGQFLPDPLREGLRLLDVAAAVASALGAAVWGRGSRRYQVRHARLSMAAALGFVLAGLAGGILAKTPSSTLLLGAIGASKVLLLAFAALHVNWTPQWKARFVASVHLSVVLVATGAVLNALFPRTFLGFFGWSISDQERVGLQSLQSIFSHPSQLAIYASFAFAVTITRYVRLRSVPDIWYAAAAAGCAVSSLRLKGLIALLAVLAVLAVLDGRRFVRRLGLIGGATLVAVILGGGGVLGSLARDQVLRYTSSTEETIRQVLYSTASDIASNAAPLGAGFGRFGSAQALRDYSPIYFEYGFQAIPGLAPNSAIATQDALWASVLGEAGWLGLICLIIWLASRTWSVAVVAGGSTGAPWALAAVAYSVSIALTAVSSPGFSFALAAVSLAIVFGMGESDEGPVAEMTMREAGPPEEQSAARPPLHGSRG